jgi:prevent-host-death family protein
MSKPDPTIRTVDANEAAGTRSELLDKVAQSHERVIVERGGTPIAAVISVADLARYKNLEAQLVREFEVLNRMADAFNAVPFEEIERETAKALANVRAGRHLGGPVVGRRPRSAQWRPDAHVSAVADQGPSSSNVTVRRRGTRGPRHRSASTSA